MSNIHSITYISKIEMFWPLMTYLQLNLNSASRQIQYINLTTLSMASLL